MSARGIFRRAFFFLSIMNLWVSFAENQTTQLYTVHRLFFGFAGVVRWSLYKKKAYSRAHICYANATEVVHGNGPINDGTNTDISHTILQSAIRHRHKQIHVN